MKVAIMCAGSKAIDELRHRFEVNGEALLDRTIRLIGDNEFYLTVSEKDHLKDFPYQKFVNKLTGNDIGCFWGCRELKPDLFVYGDVYFTKEAMQTILNGDTNFYGRTKPGKIKNYGEMFAVKTHGEFWQKLEELWEMYQRGDVKRAWSWHLYGHMQGKDFYKHRNTGNFTEITDETDDIDSKDQYQKLTSRLYGNV